MPTRESLRFRERAEASVGLASKATDDIKLGGVFEVECRRPDGSLAWRERVHNMLTLQGRNAVLDVMLHGATQITTWYCALVESNTEPASGMTYATPVFTECTAYDEATRPEYNEAAASNGITTNSANKAVATMNASKTLHGVALVGGGTAGSTKGDAAGGGTLLCYAKFASSQAVQDDYVVSTTYTISAGDDGV
jgi:hypothetical protein